MKIPTKSLSLLLLLFVIGIPCAVHGKDPKVPGFVKWMSATSPGDQAILTYWDRLQREKLNSNDVVDLGSMLFRRGFVTDAKNMFERALKMDSDNAEAWFRLGLVEHKRGNLRRARQAYGKCLDGIKGHGWCNFYMGLIEEDAANAGKALEHYSRAFRHAPELADPAINPEVLYSKLFVGALVRHTEETRFAQSMPMTYLNPGKIRGTNERMRIALFGEDEPVPAEVVKISPPADSSAKEAKPPAAPTVEKKAAPEPTMAEPPKAETAKPTVTKIGPNTKKGLDERIPGRKKINPVRRRITRPPKPAPTAVPPDSDTDDDKEPSSIYHTKAG